MQVSMKIALKHGNQNLEINPVLKKLRMGLEIPTSAPMSREQVQRAKLKEAGQGVLT